MTLRRIVIYLIAAFALRGALFGNAVIHVDEQFYLLVGDRMLHGALPYVDIWDRKPVGLFLVYAVIRLLGGDGIVAYQVIATLFVAATALVAAHIADRSPGRGGTLAGLLYLIWLMICDGAGGQAPIFYDLPMAGAAAIVVGVLVGAPRARIGVRGALAMALVGVAIQLKYTAGLEGALFGVTLLVALRRSGASWAKLVAHATVWAAIAFAPTVAAYAYYATIGQGDAFVFANFVSIFAREGDGSGGSRLVQLLAGVVALLPLAIPAAIALREERARPSSAWFMIAWLAVATVAILAVGTFRLQFFLPLLLPLSIAAGAGLSSRSGRPVGVAAAIVLLLGLAAGAFVAHDHVQRRGTAAQVAALVTQIGMRPPGCLFVFGSEPILYHLTRSCLPSRFLFRSHLAERREAGAIGVDQLGEMRRVLAGRPGVIVVRTSKGNADRRVEALLRAVLKREYRLTAVVRVGALPHRVYCLRGTPQSRTGQPLASASRRSVLPGLTATGSSTQSSIAASETSSL
ncbi:MAG TPA: hypothetical protein VF638_15480 [Sphingomonas sp.]